MSYCTLNKKTLFLFGAGASKGSEKEIIMQPPVGKDLHTFCAKTSVSWKKVIDNKELISIFDNPKQGFELGMVQLNVKNPQLFWDCHNDMNHILFQFEPSKDNLYGVFFKQLKQYKQFHYVKIATLNYDRLLPLALAAQGILPYTIAPNGACIPLVNGTNNFDACVEIILPHGASYIFADNTPIGPIQAPENYTTEEQGNWVMNYMWEKLINTDLKVIHDESNFLQQIKCYNLPAVSYIVPEKDMVGAGVPYVKFQELQRIKHIAMSADQIFVIGVNYQSHDTFWEGIKLSKASRKLQFRGKLIPQFEKKDIRFNHENFEYILNQVVFG